MQKNDIKIKSMEEILNSFITCRACGCNFLLNTGLKGNGYINESDKVVFLNLGKWIKVNKNFIYNVKPATIKADDGEIVSDGINYYLIVKNVGMSADPNVSMISQKRLVNIETDKRIVNAKWLDSGEKVVFESDHRLAVKPFSYGTSFLARVMKFSLK